MNKETISDMQGISIVILYMCGTSTIVVFGLLAEKDIWLANILAVTFAIIMGIVLSHIQSIFPEKDLFDIMMICYGKFFGGILALLFIWFAFHEATLVALNMQTFIVETTIQETPYIMIMIPFIFLCLWGAKQGIELLGRWSSLFVVLFIGFIVFIVILLIPEMDFSNIQPVLYNGIKPVLSGTFAAFTFPFGEIMVFPAFLYNFKTKKSSKRIYTIGLIISGIVVITSSLATVLVLGVDFAMIQYFPTYIAVKEISIGDTLQRIEVLAALIFLFGAFLKISVLILAACKGLSKLFRVSEYRFLVVPIGLHMLNLSQLEFPGRIAFSSWIFAIYPAYTFFNEIAIFLLVWLGAEIKKRKLKNRPAT